MKIEFGRGFTVFRRGDSPLYVLPHSGPAFEVPTSRDENADTVTSLCWMKTGGTMLVSNLSRKMSFGVDFNRNPPPKELAISLWSDFIKDEKQDRLFDFRKKYAFCASDEKEFNEKMEIYNDFWNRIKEGNNTVFMHRKFTRLKNYPSVMDFITFGGAGVEMGLLAETVGGINKKYKDFFSRIAPHYKNSIFLEEMRVADRIKNIFSGFRLENMKVEYRENMLKGMEMMGRTADPKTFEKLKQEFNENNFMDCMKSALDNAENPRVTVESIFKGAKSPDYLKALGKDRVFIGIESNAFLNYWYPDKAAEIITEVLKSIGVV